MTIDLTAAKQHCHVDFDDDDAMLTQYIAAANDHLGAIGVDMTADPLPASIDQAVLLLVAYYYDNREAVGPDDNKLVELGVDRLIAPYREVVLP